MNARRWGIFVVPVLGLAAVAGGGAGAVAAGSEPSGVTLHVGYSAWPGWFPLAVADQQGFFDRPGSTSS